MPVVDNLWRSAQYRYRFAYGRVGQCSNSYTSPRAVELLDSEGERKLDHAIWDPKVLLVAKLILSCGEDHGTSVWRSAKEYVRRHSGCG